MKAPEPITAQELDQKFDNGEDISAYFDWSKAHRPNLEQRRTGIDRRLADSEAIEDVSPARPERRKDE